MVRGKLESKIELELASVEGIEKERESQNGTKVSNLGVQDSNNV